MQDFDRKLVTKGVDDVNANAARLTKIVSNVDLILCSNAIRTSETARLVAPFLNYQPQNIVYKPEMYLANKSTLQSILFALPTETETVVIVGHNNGLSDFAQLALDHSNIMLATADIIYIKYDIKNWDKIFENKILAFKTISKY
jgi:phosphohistidine phosphatase